MAELGQQQRRLLYVTGICESSQDDDQARRLIRFIVDGGRSKSMDPIVLCGGSEEMNMEE